MLGSLNWKKTQRIGKSSLLENMKSRNKDLGISRNDSWKRKERPFNENKRQQIDINNLSVLLRIFWPISKTVYKRKRKSLTLAHFLNPNIQKKKLFCKLWTLSVRDITKLITLTMCLVLIDQFRKKNKTNIYRGRTKRHSANRQTMRRNIPLCRQKDQLMN